MKLKQIAYALSHGKSRKQLVRSEGARRVKHAEKIMHSSYRVLRDSNHTVLKISKERSQGRTETFKYMFGRKGVE